MSHEAHTDEQLLDLGVPGESSTTSTPEGIGKLYDDMTDASGILLD